MRAKQGDEARIAYAFRLVASRTPEASEIRVLKAFLESERAAFLANPQAAMDALSIGEIPRDTDLPLTEHAAWLLVCNLILNLDEALTQH